MEVVLVREGGEEKEGGGRKGGEHVESGLPG